MKEPVSMVRTLETGKADRSENMWLFTAEALALFQACLDKAD